MSFEVVRTIIYPQPTFQCVPFEILSRETFEDLDTFGGILSDLKHVWHAKGPCLEIRNISLGRKVGSWVFGGILKDSNTKIVTVAEIKRAQGKLPFLVVGLDCTISGGLICIFDIFGSKVLRVIQVKEQITSLHVINTGYENPVFTDETPLKYFDGVVAVGMLGGNVLVLDMCLQICENAALNTNLSIRDELNPCQIYILPKEKIGSVKKYIERSMELDEHLAIHLNVVVNPSTEHFTLKGEKGDDRVHVNRAEAQVSSVYYAPQIASLLIGYNFGAFQLWDLRTLKLVYFSPVCEEHIPVTHFVVQEPADDPKAYCYIWVSYSHNLKFQAGLPFAVMYSFYFDTKHFINGYGNLYKDFHHCSVRFQLELDEAQPLINKSAKVKGGTCLGFQSLSKNLVNKELNSLSLCLISWLTWTSQDEISTSILLFDLNQWYKEQMPSMPTVSYSNYMIKNTLNKCVLQVKLDERSLRQFMGIQRLEEHYCPTSLSFDLWCVDDNEIIKVHNKGSQQTLIDKIRENQHLSLVRPEDYFEHIVNLGLVPLFCDIRSNNSIDIDYQREMLLNVALEQKLIGWICKCSSKLANNAFNAVGLTIFNIMNWAFQRVLNLKNCCDQYCVPLFDYSGSKLDNNTIALLNSSTSQIKDLSSFYHYVSRKLLKFIPNKEELLEEQHCVENIVCYFEVLLWMVNIGLLPEYHPKKYDELSSNILSAPYLVQDLTQYYDRKRAQLQMVSHDTFVGKDCLLFVDNLINNKGCVEILRQQWQEDGGSGLYPPPSLQSVLRIYLLEGPDIIFKHSLVTYTLLDIAMTVDDENKIIKLLLKFPQIFDLSQSQIKIVQAFWHLDHDDYETALEYVLDSCVFQEDLQQWHHAVMLRSLLLQEQFNLALLYLQIRKPSIVDEKDLLTVISLLISKNMLDEAFKFRLHHQSANEQALLMHIFNECNKNEILHTLLYRYFDNDEERAFFTYIKNTRNPRCEDLKLFYFLLRSRFLEAFDTYSSSKRIKPDAQGLIGQRDATTADNIVKMFKTLLPNVNRDLVDVVRKERTNLWKEVRKPEPLSVFVHNVQNQVQYKSSLTFAALAKAKEMFNETINDSRFKDVRTENTPFLRTPTVFRNVTQTGTPLVKTKVIQHNEFEEFGPTPSKRLKLSPRTSKTSPVKSKNVSSSTIQSKISTPIIKRQKLSMEPSMSASTLLPQSILKSGGVSKTILDDSILDETSSVNVTLQLECENSVRRSKLGLTPRKALTRTPIKTHVKFDDIRYSGSPTEQTSKVDITSSTVNEETSGRASETTSCNDEVFYSPENSFEVSRIDMDQKSQISSVSEPTAKKSLSEEKLLDETEIQEDLKTDKERKDDYYLSKNLPLEENDSSFKRMTFQSPRSRRSYKRAFDESPTPVRSSPRLAKNSTKPLSTPEDTSKLSLDSSTVLESPLKPSSSVAVQKVRGRRSLSRAVLENNTFAKLKQSNIFEKSLNVSTESHVSSVNTTLDDSSSDSDVDNCKDDSIDLFLKKYGTDTSGLSTSFSKSESSLSDDEKLSKILNEGKVVSKTTEVYSTEIRKESVKVNKDPNEEIVTSKEIKEEYHSRKLEIFGGDSSKRLDEDKSLGVIDNNADNDKQNKDELKNLDLQETEKPKIIGHLGYNINETVIALADEINIYEDLSSGSEDVKHVLQQNKTENKSDKTLTDLSFSTSQSLYSVERNAAQIPENILDSDNSNTDGNLSKVHENEDIYEDVDMEELPETEHALIISEGDLIEISSSSEDNRSPKSKVNDSSDESSSQSSSTKSFSSNDSVRGSFVSNESYNLNTGFEENLGDQYSEPEVEKPCVSSKSEGDDVFDKETAFAAPSDATSHKSVSDHTVYEPTNTQQNENDNQIENEQREIEEALNVLTSIISEDQQNEQVEENRINLTDNQNTLDLKEELVGEEKDEDDKEVIDQRQFQVEEKQIQLERNVTKQQEIGNKSVTVQIITDEVDESKQNEVSGIEHLRNKQRSPKIEECCSNKYETDENTSLIKSAIPEVPKREINVKDAFTSITPSLNKQIDQSKALEDNDFTSSDIKNDEANNQTEVLKQSELAENAITDATPKLTVSLTKRTYSKLFSDANLDATPKLAVSLTKRTYSKTISDFSNKVDSIQSSVTVPATEKNEEMEVEQSAEKLATTENKLEEPKHEVTDATPTLDVGLVKRTYSKQIPDQIEKHLNTEYDQVSAGSSSLIEVKETSEKNENVVNEKQSNLELLQSDLKQQDSEAIKDEKNVKEPVNPVDILQSDENVEKEDHSIKSGSSMRLTRRRSQLMSQSETLSSFSEQSVNSKNDTKTPSQTASVQGTAAEFVSSAASTSDIITQSSSKRVTRRKSQMSESLFDSTKLSESSIKTDEVDIMECTFYDPRDAIPGPSSVPKQSSKVISKLILPQEDTDKTDKPKKRTRSASVDQAVSLNSRKKSLRSKSIDLDSVRSTDSKELRVILTPIREKDGQENETSDEKVPRRKVRAASDIGGYTTSRRLTRKQANMLKTIGSVEKEFKKLSSIEEIDPIHLMDKPEFKGLPDPDEKRVYEQSSPSGSSSAGPSRELRSASVLSDVSTQSTPTKSKSKGRNKSVETSIKTRLRKPSTDTMSVASEQSDSPSPSKRTKKSDTPNESTSKAAPKRTRSRTGSVSSVKSAASAKSNASLRTSRSRKVHSVHSELPEIQEEMTGDAEQPEVTTTKKRSTKKRN